MDNDAKQLEYLETHLVVLKTTIKDLQKQAKETVKNIIVLQDKMIKVRDDKNNTKQ